MEISQYGLRSSLFQLSDLNDTLAALKSFVARFMARTWSPSPSSLWVSKLSRQHSLESSRRRRGPAYGGRYAPPIGPRMGGRLAALKSLVSAKDWRNTTVVTNWVYQRVSAKWSNDPDDLWVAVDETSIWTSCKVFNWVTGLPGSVFGRFC